MRIIFLMAFIMLMTQSKAQTFVPGNFAGDSYSRNFSNNLFLKDSSTTKKWFVSRYSAISASYLSFRGGGASVLSAPMGLQLNRKINSNLYAFANATVAPAYVNFNRSFLGPSLLKSGQNNMLKSSNFGVYSSASLGLTYVNDEKTFSLSGSISVETSTYPALSNYRTNLRQPVKPDDR